MEDRGYWVNWYDLPEDGREDYLEWLHGSYIPKRMEQSDVLWAAHYECEAKVEHPGEKGRLSHTERHDVPSGDRFILLFGGETPHAFTNPTPDEFHQSLTDEDRKMLSMRIGARSNILAEEARVEGPETAQRNGDLTTGPCIQMGSFNSGLYTDEDELSAWYAQWRLPTMKHLKGCIGARKLVSVSGWAKHVILYEWVSVEARNAIFVNHEASNPEMEDWTDRVVRKLDHAPGSPNLAHRLWPEINS